MNAATLISLQQGPWWCPMCQHGHAWGWGMWIWMILFWLIVIGLIAWLISRLTKRRGSEPKGGAEDARERYARGEIDSQTYHRMLDDLRGGTS